MADTITSKNLPPTPAAGKSVAPPPGLPPKQPEETVVIPYEQIEAKPLRSPNFINLKAKNPALYLYWGNRAVGEKESGLRYDQLIAMGFQPAQPQDVVTVQNQPCPPSLCRDNRIMYGDLILLKIPRTEYLGALKWNEQSARQRVKKPGVALEGGSREHQAADSRLSPTSALNIPSKKVSTFVPNLAETDAKTADNSGPTSDFNLADKT